MCAKSLQSCPTLCNPMDHSLPGSFVHEILQARTLEWVAMPSSRGPSLPRDWSASLISPASPALAGGFFTMGATWEPSFRESSLSPQSLIPPSWSSWGLFVFIFLDFPGVSDTTDSFHLGTLFTKPLFHLFLCSILLLPTPYSWSSSLVLFLMASEGECSQIVIIHISFHFFLPYVICFPNCNSC